MVLFQFTRLNTILLFLRTAHLSLKQFLFRKKRNNRTKTKVVAIFGIKNEDYYCQNNNEKDKFVVIILDLYMIKAY